VGKQEERRLNPIKHLGGQQGQSVADALFDFILAKIAQGAWPVGHSLPGEKDLMQQFGISRVAVRECVLKLRTLGILTASRGKRTAVAKIDTRLMGHLFPLILLNEGPQAFEHVFQIRLVIESQCACLAAKHRSEEDHARLTQILAKMKAIPQGDTDTWIEQDHRLHLRIAHAAQNPLFAMLTEALWGFLHRLHPVIHKDCAERRTSDEHYHSAIVEAIVLQNPDRARIEMEAHLLSSADYIRGSGALISPAS
jgi:DNA-binding FadR family transcriptional regulator